jgi:hypothetical protein
MMRSSARRSSRSRRCNVMLEFAMTLPFMLFLLAFSIDMGRMVYAMNAAQQATATAARQAAVFGVAGANGTEASTDANPTRAAVIATCNDTVNPAIPSTAENCKMGLYAMRTAIANTPGGGLLQDWEFFVIGKQATDAEGAESGFGRICTAATPLVRIELHYEMDWLTPGMKGLIGAVGSNTTTNNEKLERAQIATTATARCEVEYAP